MTASAFLNEKELKLVEEIKNFQESGVAAKTKLETDEKVLARVTDGIYRLPGSAIRELISNAYDADAENVIIDTDVPRFQTITVRDDGNGMSVETLVNLLNHVGASAKRSFKGNGLEVTDQDDNTLSRNKKRKLIGKIGIGLFSVAQLTRDFDIITKQKNTDFYLKAKIRLHNYSEEYIRDTEIKAQKEGLEARGASFETGIVEIWTEPTDNYEAHGTDIILRNIKKSAQDQLRSIDIWGQESAEAEKDGEKGGEEDILNSSKLEKPNFHVGNYFGNDGFEYYADAERQPKLPWSSEDKAHEKLSKLYDAVLSLTKETTNPKLGVVLDNYLNMLWTLSLSIPLNYIDKHPFHHSTDDIDNLFVISNKLKGQCEDFPKSTLISTALKNKKPYENLDFNVTIDGVQLFRPLKFKDLPKSGAAVKDPILFIGSYSPDLSSLDLHDSGGGLSFDAYILWAPKIIPRDHNGSLIRVNNSSGTLFDETFMKHQVAEHTIKSQLTIEIFVNNGLDSALNIDRESFNISHPHYQMIMKWLHQAIRQVVTKYKTIKKEALKANNTVRAQKFESGLTQIVKRSVEKSGLDYSDVSNLFLVDGEKAASSSRGEVKTADLPIETVKVNKKRFLELSKTSSSATAKIHSIEAKTEAIVQVLESYGALNNLNSTQRERLIEDIIQIISFEG
ncbi:ATP-binding protein [Pseudomonas sp. F(2018)]|uniref:ATP-binding protein n=1 Tax=Pseudomonas sp. F(2018) TaxID=2502240 RepID=UPI0010F44487|nr:ATP-binding protein [Pseudomonas sp. F(2018)]